MQFHALLRFRTWSVFPLRNCSFGSLHQNWTAPDRFDLLNAAIGADHGNDLDRSSKSDPFCSGWILWSYSADDSASAFGGGLLVLGPYGRRQRVGEGNGYDNSEQTLHTLRDPDINLVLFTAST